MIFTTPQHTMQHMTNIATPASPNNVNPAYLVLNTNYNRQRMVNNEQINKFRQDREVVIQPPQDPKKKSMKWGEPTWFLFHTLAQKVKDEDFKNIRSELLNIIYSICVNLPCPDCASHATSYMNNINFNVIQSKQQLKDMLFAFHNTVNLRKGYKLFNHDELDEKYNSANTNSIIRYFMEHFKNRHSSIHMIANDMHRGRIVNILVSWFNVNIVHFEP